MPLQPEALFGMASAELYVRPRPSLIVRLTDALARHRVAAGQVRLLMASVPRVSDRPKWVASKYRGIGGRQALSRLQLTVLEEQRSVSTCLDFVQAGFQSDRIFMLRSCTSAKYNQTAHDHYSPHHKRP